MTDNCIYDLLWITAPTFSIPLYFAVRHILCTAVSIIRPFFQGNLTSPEAAQLLEEAISGDQEKLIDILLYRKDGKQEHTGMKEF